MSFLVRRSRGPVRTLRSAGSRSRADMPDTTAPKRAEQPKPLNPGTVASRAIEHFGRTLQPTSYQTIALLSYLWTLVNDTARPSVTVAQRELVWLTGDRTAASRCLRKLREIGAIEVTAAPGRKPQTYLLHFAPDEAS